MTVRVIFTRDACNALPRPVGRGKGLPALKKEAFAPPSENYQNLQAQRDKVDFNPLKFGRQLQERIQIIQIKFWESVDLCAFFASPRRP